MYHIVLTFTRRVSSLDLTHNPISASENASQTEQLHTKCNKGENLFAAVGKVRVFYARLFIASSS